MTPRRPTARTLLAVLAASAGLLAPASVGAAVPRLIFPVVGPATFSDDFATPRGTGRHQGIDILAQKKSPAVAVEAGKVKFWTTSATAGCMLYLYGASGTTYLYIHLNNDLTSGNDNTGACVQGVSYASGLKDGARVRAGQMIGYVGDSGDANGGASHLHFEVHPNDGAAVDGYPYLMQARKLLFAPAPGSGVFRLALRGKVVAAAPTAATVAVDRLVRYPGQLKMTNVGRKVRLAVAPETVVYDPLGALIATAQLAELAAGKPAQVWTETQPTTLQAALGAPLAITADRITLGF